MSSNKNHWENVFSTKSRNQVSWTQEYPKTSIDYIESLSLPKSANIIDVGGGDSNLVDALLDRGYQNIWVLDISETALDKARNRLAIKAQNVNWIVTDILEFQSDIRFDFWHDRAVFHFLTESCDIEKYVNLVCNLVAEGGGFLLGTFSENGPQKCSGLNITQYNDIKMKETFDLCFQSVKCFSEDHITPFNTVQNFQFCGFKKIKIRQQVMNPKHLYDESVKILLLPLL